MKHPKPLIQVSYHHNILREVFVLFVSLWSTQNLVFALKTPGGHAYYTDNSLNRDGCDHIRKLQPGTDRWEHWWEDMYGLGERDFNDVVLDVSFADAGESADPANATWASSKDYVGRSSKSIDCDPSSGGSSESLKSNLSPSPCSVCTTAGRIPSPQKRGIIPSREQRQTHLY